MIEENVVSAAGAHFRLTEAEIARAIQDAGFVPKRRTMHYEIVGDPYCWTPRHAGAARQRGRDHRRLIGVAGCPVRSGQRLLLRPLDPA